MVSEKVLEEVEVGQPELNQNTMKTKERSEGINVTELSVSQTDDLGKALHSDLVVDPILNSTPPSPGETPPIIFQDSVEISHNGNLFPSSITPENLFDIQIREIDEDLENFDKHLDILGKTVKAFNENINSLSIQNSPNKGRGTRKTAENLMGGIIYLESNSATHLVSRNPNPKRSKRKWKKQAHTEASGKHTHTHRAVRYMGSKLGLII